MLRVKYAIGVFVFFLSILFVSPVEATSLCSYGGIETLFNKGDHDLYPNETFVRIYNRQDITALNQLENLTCVEYADFYNEGLTGDLSSLSSLVNLQVLNLHTNPKITGSICSLQNATKLKTLKLAFDPKITGDLSCFSKINLDSFAMTYTGISGDLSSLSHMTNLKELYLTGTKVKGNIASLANLTNLEQLVIEDTEETGSKITGDLTSLSNLKKLKKVALYNMDVTNCDQFTKSHPRIEQGGCSQNSKSQWGRSKNLNEKSENLIRKLFPEKFSSSEEVSSSRLSPLLIIAVVGGIILAVGTLIFAVLKMRK